MIRKFYDDGAAEPAGGSVTIGASFNLGDLNAPSTETSPEAVEPTQAEPAAAPAEPTTEPLVTEPAVTEPVTDNKPAAEQKAEEPKVEEPKAEEAKVPQTLDEVLKGKDRKEILAAIGIDQAFIDILDSAKSLDELKNILDNKTRDWDKVPAEELLRQNLLAEYADLDPAKFEKVFKAELKKYNLDSFDEDEKELGEIRLERDAKKIRDQRKQEQASFKYPEPKPGVEAQQLQEIKAQQDKAKTDYEAYVQEINANEQTKRLMQDKRLTLAGDYKFEVEPKAVVDGIVDTNKLFASCINADGSYNLERAYKISAYAQNMEKIEAALVAHGKSQENKELLDEYVNPKTKEATAASKKEESIGEAFVSRGTHTTMGAILGR